jgi:predicted metal-binding protein
MFRVVPSRWTHTILVCAKCEKKLGGGFGEKGKRPLSKLLRQMFGKGRKAQIGVVSVKCLGICPKNAVTIVDSRAPGEWILVAARTAIEDVAAALAD